MGTALYTVLLFCLWMGACLKKEPSFFCSYGDFLLSKTMFIQSMGSPHPFHYLAAER